MGTEDYITLHQISEQTKFLKFAVKGNDGMSIKITGATENEQYEVLLSGIAKSFIRELPDKTITQRTTENLYNDVSYTDFWITWTDGELEVGRGTELGRNIFLQTDKILSKVESVAIATKNGHQGNWTIGKGGYNF